MRRSRNLFHTLLFGMLLLGLAIGALFPVFMIQLGFLARGDVHLPFVFAALAAGLVAGAINFMLAASIVRPRLRVLATRMEAVRAALRHASFTGDRTQCDPEQCSVPEHGSDELGVAALDPLTGVYNRGFGMRRLEEELARAERAHGPVALLIIDIDHFKKVNDSFGHLAGDRVLVIVSQVCRDVLREGDLLMRYGGEEFMAILPGASLADASAVAERMRFGIASTPVETDAGLVMVTASVGVAASPGGVAVAAEAFIGIADSRLYAAKSGGRNRVIARDL
jgi:diguanylate cyclase (GGDEF)-like protein